jgi:hypothetical protein
MNKTVRVILSEEAKEVYKYLNKQAPVSKVERTILNSVNSKIELIKNNYHYGEPISKKKIPKEYKEKYDVSNLFWVPLSNYWRMLYTLTSGETTIEIIAFVVDILNHPDYDKKFGYKKR